ncbi:protein FAM171A2-like isoform X1 [Salmo salar]|uniref:Protein FAM171A2-like isoform X1 n=1 Tax=Salmo salar TaxID=8030 RepID=A0ABM3EZW1_SALSA|nr:protein FAM171A2-like isoform X1 [Salmo salar]
MPNSKAIWMNGHLSGIDDIAVRMPPPHTSRLLFLFLFLGNLWEGLAKSISDQGALEVLVRVQVFDNSDLSPLAEAAVDVYGNQSTLASSKAGKDGVVMVTFLYRPGTWVIVTATKQGFVTNSAPWHASRIPLYASVSLYLLPQRPATLILYDDIVQVLLGSPGVKNQPWIQLQRKAVALALNSTNPELSAVLTSAQSQYEIGGFPYPLGLESNATGANSSWVELTAVAAVNAQLFSRNGTGVQVWDPVHICIPLPLDTPLQTATSVPVWRFDDKTGLWVRKGTGYIKKEGTQLTWSFVANQLGYWLAAFPSTTGSALNPTGLQDITTYHTVFLLTILGSMALLVLVLLCLLLYYCRRRCLKPRQQYRHGKMHVSSGLDGSKRDQCTSMSHLNLISSGHIHIDTASSTRGDPDALKSDLSSTRDLHSSREDFFRHTPPGKAQRHAKVNTDNITRRGGGESFPMKVTTRSTNTNNLDPQLLLRNDTRSFSSAEDNTHDPRHRHNHQNHNANDNQGYSSDPPSPPPLLPPFAGHYQEYSGLPPEYSASQTGDLLARPNSLNTQPGQLIFCHSMDQMKESMYRSVVPTLVIPAHYMRLPSDLSAVEQALERQQQMQHDMEGIQVSMTLPRQQGQVHQNQQQKQPNQQQQNHQQEDEEGEEPGQQREDSEGHSNWASDPNAAPVRIPVLFNDNTISQMNGELQALTEKKLLELGVKPHPRAWFVPLDGCSNSLVRHSYIELGGESLSIPGGGGGGGATGSHHDNRVDVAREANIKQRKGKEERKAKEAKEAAAAAERKGHAGKTYSKLPCIDTTDPPSSSSESHAAMYSPEDNSLAPLLDEAPEKTPRGGTFPRKGRSRDSARSSTTTTSTSEVTRRDPATSPEDGEDADDKDEEGNKKSPWQKREERPLMVWK